MPALKRYRLFISHAWRYHDDYVRFINLLDEAPLFEYANYSVPRDDKFDKMSSTALGEEIMGQIRPVQCVIILGGLYVSYSDWIQYEIDYAKQMQKPIIAVMPWGSTVTPKAVTQAANIIVGWNTNSFVSAIRDYSI
ncbi:TIR domain-containing protein [Hymenobacter sp. PAMC 26628]|uniref:TIR domain-containing protein n=1 Tax=Hymenobacter sp. PAMC 26628 TaxID=1484118 RepID=UPI0009007480|nr:TIR domain-containing protein [Hymenobacter sp. PAMC 26628]